MTIDEVNKKKAKRHERDIRAVMYAALIAYEARSRKLKEEEADNNQCSIRGWPTCGL